MLQLRKDLYPLRRVVSREPGGTRLDPTQVIVLSCGHSYEIRGYYGIGLGPTAERCGQCPPIGTICRYCKQETDHASWCKSVPAKEQGAAHQ